MKVYKKLSRWWQDAYGGEHQVHADFEIEAGDTFASAFHDLFKHDGDLYWLTPVQAGQVRKVHILFSVTPEVTTQ